MRQGEVITEHEHEHEHVCQDVRKRDFANQGA